MVLVIELGFSNSEASIIMTSAIKAAQDQSFRKWILL